jgi:arsenite methyltransferase
MQEENLPSDGGDGTVLRSLRGGKEGYGIDQPRVVIQLVTAGLITIVTGFVVASAVKVNPDLVAIFLIGMPLCGLLILAIAASFYWSSRLGKPREVERLVREVPWGGTEVALDVGCGRGLMMVDAAKRLHEGYSVGVDLWKSGDLSGNNPQSIWTNAREAGAGDKVFAITADARYLPIADGSVDVAMSAMTIHLVGGSADRKAALRELARVLKEGGRIAVLDAGGGGEYASSLRDNGIVDIRLKRLRYRSFPPLHSVAGRKAFTK